MKPTNAHIAKCVRALFKQAGQNVSAEELARWHEERAALHLMKLQEARDDGLSHGEQERLKQKHTFHLGSARGLTQLATAFETLSALTER